MGSPLYTEFLITFTGTGIIPVLLERIYPQNSSLQSFFATLPDIFPSQSLITPIFKI
jgi:hypothetical protein